MPIISEPGHNGGYSLLNNFIRTPLFFDLEEKKSLLQWKQAVANECSVEIEYCTGYEGHPKRRVVDPYGMLYWNNKWYTVAFCHLRNEIRSFKVDRIVNIISTKNSFKRPEAFSAREFLQKTYYPMWKAN
ncbi:hypothetical protein WY13_02749 [Clostridium ljungdahlii]|uniref:WYL domain-containing protein n=1 Tax=Clostridium ljungdahlii TaxID=1538 RepID=A0A162KVY9_9CLOT|nr:WYL domain-containing protein [Clostridium ljungdahlii]OAA84846.1 hypothetical protein WY13_02749 [Clostridium ljungdahlii]